MKDVMGTVETRNRIHSAINEISPEKLDDVLSFLEDLQRSSEEETVMLTSDSTFMKDYQKAKENIRTGKTVGFKTIRRDA